MNSIKHTILTLMAMGSILGCAPKRQDAGQAVLDNIFSRKSVRSYTEQAVSPEQVETLLKAALRKF